jgi:uncharacterized protein YbjT (DUF2867 family)
MILITGATGYVASHLLPRIAEAKLPARGMARSAKSLDKVRRHGLEAVQGDVTDKASIERAMQDVRTVVHLAAINRDGNDVTLEDVNHVGTAKVVEAAKAAGVRHIINVIGLGADANSRERLPRSQGRAKDVIRTSGIPYTIIEPSVIFGRGDEFINTIAGLIRLAPIVPLPAGGTTQFQPIWVGDVAEAIMHALHAPDKYQGVFPCGGPEVMTYEDIVDIVARVMDKRVMKISVPVGLLRPAVTIMDSTLPKPPVTPQLLDLLGQVNVPNPNTAITVFGLDLLPLEKGIDYVHELTAGQFINRTLGRIEYR